MHAFSKYEKIRVSDIGQNIQILVKKTRLILFRLLKPMSVFFQKLFVKKHENSLLKILNIWTLFHIILGMTKAAPLEIKDILSTFQTYWIWTNWRFLTFSAIKDKKIVPRKYCFYLNMSAVFFSVCWFVYILLFKFANILPI